MGYFHNIKDAFRVRNYKNYFIIAAIFAIVLILDISGVLPRSYKYLAAQIGYSIILAVSLNLVVGFLGELSLGHAGFMCTGCYIGCFAINYLSSVIPNKTVVIIIAMLIGGAVAGVFGIIVGIPALRLKGDYLAIVTLAFGEIVRNLFKNLPWFGGAMGMSTVQYGPKLYIIAFAVLFVMVILLQNLIHSKHGRAITAIRDSEIAARSMGINVTYYKLLVFVIAAIFAGMAGVIYGSYTTPVLYSTFSFNYSIEILVMVVLGGMGNITGSIFASILITFINFILQSQLSGDLAAIKFLVYALILIIVVIFNNAPALKPFKEKISKKIQKFRPVIIRYRNKPEKAKAVIHDDKAEWSEIPTKISTDEVLSTDLVNPEGEVRDHGDKPTAK